jgi:hypothetical protein
MESSLTLPFHELLRQMVSIGLYQPIETLIEEYPYLVIDIDINDHDIFVILGYNFIDELIIIQLPQSLHESFRTLIIINRLNNVNTFLIEYVGNTDSGYHILHAYGNGFSINV